MNVEIKETYPNNIKENYPFIVLYNNGIKNTHHLLVLESVDKDFYDAIMINGTSFYKPFTFRSNWRKIYCQPFNGEIILKND